MSVLPEELSATYQGRNYFFCSDQCRDRFLANPHLYIGTPGNPAPKSHGQQVLKRRRFSLDRVPNENRCRQLSAIVSEMMGIEAFEILEAEVVVTYDLLQATAAQIEAKLEAAGATLGAGWAERLRRGFVHYTEECEIDNLEIKPSSGCHG